MDLFNQISHAPTERIKGVTVVQAPESYNHGKENLPENTALYQSNLAHFDKQCTLVLSLMQAGVKLTTTEALKHGIGDLRARCRDLLNAGVPIKKEFAKDADGKTTRYKVYFL